MRSLLRAAAVVAVLAAPFLPELTFGSGSAYAQQSHSITLQPRRKPRLHVPPQPQPIIVIPSHPDDPVKNFIEDKLMSPTAFVLAGGAFLLFFFLLPGLFILQPRHEAIVLRWGKFIKVIRGEGIRWSQPWGRTITKVSTQDQTFEVHKTTVVEVNGNPIEISAIVTYRVEDSRKASLDVVNYQQFVRDQATSVVKRVAAHFPYESPHHDVPCLRKESPEVGKRLIDELQGAVLSAGVHILGVRINDLTYAPEIAQAMLMRQQAMAVVDARKTIVEGAVEIVRSCIERLEKAGVTMSSARREELVTNLLVVICSGERVTPTVTLSTRPSASGTS